MITDLFPTKIYEARVSDFEVIQKEFENIEQNIKWQNLWDTHLISDPSFQENILPYHFSQELKTHL